MAEGHPKGILKNKDDAPHMTTVEASANAIQHNTLANAKLSPATGSGAMPGVEGTGEQSAGDQGQRLKWDEANLYLTEQEKSSTMKITEPKTPYAPHYDPAEDLDEQMRLDGEMDLDGGVNITRPAANSRVEDIPSLDIGAPEEEMDLDEPAQKQANGRASLSRSNSGGEKHVQVSADAQNPTDAAVDEEQEFRTPEEEEKHRQFERMRKQHYGNAAAALRRPSMEVDEDEDEEDE